MFNPPLMRAPFSIQWPDDLPNLVFASHTSLVDAETLKDKLKE